MDHWTEWSVALMLWLGLMTVIAVWTGRIALLLHRQRQAERLLRLRLAVTAGRAGREPVRAPIGPAWMAPGGWRAVLAFVALFALAGAEEAAGRKKLIETGWDEPDPAFMRKHLAQLEATPFDGCVYHILYRRADGSSGRFTWESWGRHAFTEEDVAPALRDLQATPFRRFTDNFLRFNTTPADLDWFDDYSAVIGNARLAASVARRGGSKGIMLDVEMYMGRLFEYPRQRDAAKRSWKEYAAQARRRGREVMEAFQEGYPDLTVFLTFGYNQPWLQTIEDRQPIEKVSYGLLAPFLDGMVEAARGRTRIVDGHERSYTERDPARFPALYRRMERDVLPIVADPAKYRRVFSFAFGIRMDERVRGGTWWPADPAKNYFPPVLFEKVVRRALESADEYVWIYSEAPRWWTAEGGRKDLPDAYDRVLRSAKSGP